MIHFYEFLKGAGLALTLFGALYAFAISEEYSFLCLCVGALPGLFVFIISVLLVENYELRQKRG